MLKIKVKTESITLEIEDQTFIGKDGYTKHRVPDLLEAIDRVISEAIRLHNETK